MPYPSLLHPESLPLWQSTADPYLTGNTQTQFCLSLCGVSGSWCAQGLFEPSDHFWQVWHLILNANLSLLPSCWGFSALGHEVSSHSCSHAAQSPLPHCVTRATLEIKPEWSIEENVCLSFDAGSILSRASFSVSSQISSCRPILYLGAQNWVGGGDHWIIEKAREFQKNIYRCFIDYVKAFDCMDHHKLWKILKEMGIPDHLTCLLRNL